MLSSKAVLIPNLGLQSNVSVTLSLCVTLGNVELVCGAEVEVGNMECVTQEPDPPCTPEPDPPCTPEPDPPSTPEPDPPSTPEPDPL